MALLRFAIDLGSWRSLTRGEQELLVGRDRDTGAPLLDVDAEGAPVSRPSRDPESDRLAFVDPPETTNPAIEQSHVHRANQSRASPDAPAALRIFRQGYDFLDTTDPRSLVAGLNFVSFHADLATLIHLLHAPGWLGDANFGGDQDAPRLIALADGGLYVVPPQEQPFPGAALFG
jgi:deferrochelatase/peroxidase EfeB